MTILGSAVSTFVVLAGQSNMVVPGVTAAEAPGYYQVTAQIQIWDKASQSFQIMVPGVNTHAGNLAYAQSWGPEVEFAYQWAKDHPAGEVLYFIKQDTAKGETGLAADPAVNDWSPSSTGEQFAKATAQIAAAKAAIAGDFNTVVLWMQGENDAIDPAKDAAYGDNFVDLLKHFESDWRADQVLVGRIADEWGLNSNVRRVQTDYGSVNTDQFAMQGDNRHFAPSGVLDLGAGFYAQLNSSVVSTNGSDAADRLVGSTQADHLWAGGGDDVVVSGEGVDDLHGNAGNDVIYAGAGDDLMNGGKGDDHLNADDGDDKDFGAAGNDTVQGGLGNDVLTGDAGDDQVQGNVGQDSVSGGDGIDFLYGGQGADSLSGGAGGDFLSGDKGDDWLNGAAGADRFSFAPGCGADTVTDFSTADGDKVCLVAGQTNTLSLSGADTVVSLDGGDSITLVGVHLTSLDWLVTL